MSYHEVRRSWRSIESDQPPLNFEDLDRLRTAAARMQRVGERLEGIDEKSLSPEERERVRLDVLEVIGALTVIGLGSTASAFWTLAAIPQGLFFTPSGAVALALAGSALGAALYTLDVLVNGKKVHSRKS